MAKRHLKLSGRLIENNTRVEVKVLEQSHYGSEFGNTHPREWGADNYQGHAFYSDQACIVSHPYDHFEWYYVEGSTSNAWLLVRFSPKVDPNRTMIVNLEEWQRIKKAVAAYNKWGDTQ